MENIRHVERYRTLGREGVAKFTASLYRRANTFCSTEARKMVITPKGSPNTDDLYTTQEVEIVLVAILNNQSDTIAAAGDDVWTRIADVSGAWTSMRPAEKKLLHLRYGRGLPYDEIAKELNGIESDAARMRVGRAIQRLRLRSSQTWTPPTLGRRAGRELASTDWALQS